MAADGSNIVTLRPPLRIIESAPAGRHDFSRRAPSFRPAETPGAAWLGTARLEPDAVEALLKLFEREAWKSGDYRLFDELRAAADGLDPEPQPEPPEAA